MGKIVLKEMRGINAGKASLQLQPGETEFSQNVVGRPFHNWAKRRGVATAEIDSNPINGIFEAEFDNITIPFYQAGDTLTFFPVLPLITGSGNLNDSDDGSTPSSLVIDPIYPDPYPAYNPIDPGGAILFRIEEVMRTVQERALRVGLTGFTWPNRLYDSSGNSINESASTQLRSAYYSTATGSAQFPANSFYAYDLYWHDTKNGNPAGTRAAVLVNAIVSAINTSAFLNQYLAVTSSYQPYIEGQADPYYYDTATSGFYISVWTAGSAPTATAANYRQVLGQCRDAVRRLLFTFASASQVNITGSGNLENRIGTGNGASCSDSQTLAGTAWDSASWTLNGPGTFINQTESVDSATPQSTISANRGKVLCDLTPYIAGTGYFFLKVEPNSGTSSNSPPVTADNLYHQYATSIAVGASRLSPELGNSKPTFSIVCPDSGSRGWILANQLGVIQLQFNYVS